MIESSKWVGFEGVLHVAQGPEGYDVALTVEPGRTARINPDQARAVAAALLVLAESGDEANAVQAAEEGSAA